MVVSPRVYTIPASEGHLTEWSRAQFSRFRKYIMDPWHPCTTDNLDLGSRYKIIILNILNYRPT